MIIESISAIASPPLFYRLKGFVPHVEVFVKLEGLNVAGSIKLITARGLLESFERDGRMTPKTKLIESSSGNLGLALSIFCKEKGYDFTCVTDPNILPENERLIQLYGANLVKITKKDANGGYLGSRIEYIHALINENSNYIWLNQYANKQNSAAHYSQTASDIFSEFPSLDYLFIGAGTTGTLMGCASYFKKHCSQTKIIAVDSIGSVTFGFPAKKRYIPGIGTSRRPEIVDETLVDQILLINEHDGVKMCRYLLQQYGLFLGGSSGSVLQAVLNHADQIPPGSVVVAISPDFGHKYIHMVYDDLWVQEKFTVSTLV